MLSVTQRIATVSQPQGGYIPDGLFTQTQYEDYQVLQSVETDDKYLLSLQGAAVDYLTRYMLCDDKHEAFHISILGAHKLDDAYENNDASSHISELLSQVVGLDDDSIKAACRITGYDVAYRMGIRFYKDVDEIKPPIEMVSNIRIMVCTFGLKIAFCTPQTPFCTAICAAYIVNFTVVPSFSLL